jgi:hypothetical protein
MKWLRRAAGIAGIEKVLREMADGALKMSMRRNIGRARGGEAGSRRRIEKVGGVSGVSDSGGDSNRHVTCELKKRMLVVLKMKGS